ncbi:MAG: hypothetical protein V1804_02645 [Patescibacteria group bacterium]
MGLENFSDAKEKKELTQEELNEAKDREFDEKIKRRRFLSVNEKQELLKEIKERNFSRGLLVGATKEEVEIETELNKKSENSELQSEKKTETSKINDASEDLDKELDEELHKYTQAEKEKREKELESEMHEVHEGIMEKLGTTESFEKLQKNETDNKIQEEKEQFLLDNIAERKQALEEVKKLGESADIDVSDALSDIQKQIEELKKQAG